MIAPVVRSCKRRRPQAGGLDDMRLLRALASHPVEVIAGIILVVVGVMLTATSTGHSHSTKNIVIGAVATAFGGVILSWTTGKSLSRTEALEDIRSQLDLVSRNLGQASGQISRAVEQAQIHELQPATGFALVAQAATMIYGQVSAIQTILGDRFDAEDLLFTVKELESLAVRLERRGTGADLEVDAVRNRLQEMRTQLARSTVTQAKASESVSCPHCNRMTVVAIGLNGGDTSSARCSNCGGRFNAHRRADGSLIERPAPNGSDNTVSLDGQCPKCRNEIKVRPSNMPLSGKVSAICMECAAKVEFDLNSRQLVYNGQMVKMPGVIVSRYGTSGAGARPVIRCEKCDRNVRCIVRKGTAYYAIDNECDRLYQVNNPEFATWRAEHDVEAIPKTNSTSNSSIDPVAESVTLHFGSAGESPTD